MKVCFINIEGLSFGEKNEKFRTQALIRGEL